MELAKLAYLAGFFDGEGCIYIPRARKKGNMFFNLEISFTGSDIAPLLFAQEAFQGQISTSTHDRPDRKDVHRLRIRSNQARVALEEMLPLLIVKKQRAVLGIEFQSKLCLAGTSGKRSLSIDECEQYKTAITSMNDKIWNRDKLLP